MPTPMIQILTNTSYEFNRDGANALTISSPTSAHKSHTITVALTALDMDLELPVFAALEIDYREAENSPDGNHEKILVFYEYDLSKGVRRQVVGNVDTTSNMLIPVPYGSKGPGGVLVCSENYLIYYPSPSFYGTKRKSSKARKSRELQCYVPRRMVMPEEVGLLITKYVLVRRKNVFFFLLASEYGDLYKLTLDFEGDVVEDVTIKYFDTVENPSTMTFLKNGTLFVSSENGAPHILYQFSSIGDNESVSCSAKDSSMKMETEDGKNPNFEYFMPTENRNLEQVSTIQNYAPVVDFMMDGESRSLLTLSGKGSKNASLNVIQSGINVVEMANSALPGRPNNIFTLKLQESDEFDSYIVVSFENATICLSIGATVNELKSTETGILGDVSTISIGLMGENSIVQVHANGARQIKRDSEGLLQFVEWRPDGKKTVSHAAFNASQLVISLNGGELVYFEVTSDGELTEIRRKDLEVEISAVTIEPLSEGRIRSSMMAVSTWDSSVMVLDLNPENAFQILAVQNLSGSDAESIDLSYLRSLEGPDAEEEGEEVSGGEAPRLYLHIGLSNGVLMRNVVDGKTGALSDQRLRVLGRLPVRLQRIGLGTMDQALLAMSSQSWLEYTYDGRIHLLPLSYLPLSLAAAFVSEQCPENGAVVVTSDEVSSSLRIFSIPQETLGSVFHNVNIPLRYTPRRIVSDSISGHIAIIETEHERISYSKQKEQYGSVMEKELKNVQMSVGFLEQEKAEWVNCGIAKWASCVRLLARAPSADDPRDLFKLLDVTEFDEDEAAVSAAFVSFASAQGQGQITMYSTLIESALCVGSVASLDLRTQTHAGGYIRTYITEADEAKGEDEGEPNLRLKLIHRTPVDGIPQSVHAFMNMLLVGVGRELRLYSYGKKRLLKKCVNRMFPSPINNIYSTGDRIYVSTVADSVYFVKYRKLENILHAFAMDVPPRAVTAFTTLDYDTLLGTDKFGNTFVVRCPQRVSEDADKDVTGGSRDEIDVSPNTENHLETLCNFHIGETVNSIHKGAITPGCDAVVYISIGGTIGTFIPITSKEEVDFFVHVEMHIRDSFKEEVKGRDHMSFRSSYFPVKNVIDGDLCELFLSLDKSKQREIAEGMDRSVPDICKKIEEMRNRV